MASSLNICLWIANGLFQHIPELNFKQLIQSILLNPILKKIIIFVYLTVYNTEEKSFMFADHLFDIFHPASRTCNTDAEKCIHERLLNDTATNETIKRVKLSEVMHRRTSDKTNKITGSDLITINMLKE